MASPSDDVNSETARPHRLPAQHEVIVGPRDDPHETLIIYLRQSSAAGGRTFMTPKLPF